MRGFWSEMRAGGVNGARLVSRSLFPERIDQIALSIGQPPFDDDMALADAENAQRAAWRGSARAAPQLVARLHQGKHARADACWHLRRIDVNERVLRVVHECMVAALAASMLGTYASSRLS